MISQNHFKQPIRAFVLDMFDIQLDEHVLDKIRQAEHLLSQAAIPVVIREDQSGQHRQIQTSSEQATPAKPSVPRLASYNRGPPAQTNLNDPSTRTRQVLQPIAKQEGFPSPELGDKHEELFL
jgi:hypothetical protein